MDGIWILVLEGEEPTKVDQKTVDSMKTIKELIECADEVNYTKEDPLDLSSIAGISKSGVNWMTLANDFCQCERLKKVEKHEIYCYDSEKAFDGYDSEWFAKLRELGKSLVGLINFADFVNYELLLDYAVSALGCNISKVERVGQVAEMLDLDELPEKEVNLYKEANAWCNDGSM